MPAALLILFCFLLFPANAQAWPASIINIYDGDTITVAPAGDESCPLFVRLYGIDAPELQQKGGQEAKKWLAEQLKMRMQVEIIPMKTDQYGRVEAMVVRNGKVLNGELIRAGHAWVWPARCVAMVCRTWTQEQKKAAEKKLGLWLEENPIAPWTWSKREQTQGTLLPLTKPSSKQE